MNRNRSESLVGLAIILPLVWACEGDARSSAKLDAGSEASSGSATSSDAGLDQLDAGQSAVTIQPLGIDASSGTPATPGGSSSRPALSMPGGVLWKTYNRVSGVEAFSLEGGPWRSITPRLSDLAPTSDGARYAYAQEIALADLPDNSPASYAETEIGVVNMDERQTLYQAKFTTTIYRPQPSPTDQSLVLALSQRSTSATAPVDWVILDLAQKVPVKRFPGTGWVAWLPDGRYLHLYANGELRVGSVTSEETSAGALSLPLGTSAGTFTINQQGTRIAVRVYSSAGSGGGVDVYVADIDGSNFERFTKTGWSSYGIWSPDGRYLAFNYDRDVRCGDNISLSCLHSDCEIHYAPESARDIVIQRTMDDPPRFSAKNADGNLTYVPCNVFAWTPGKTPAPAP